MTQTPSTPDEIVALSLADFEVIKRACLDDPWIFAKVVCRRDKQNEWFHKPLLYVNTGQGERLVGMLNDRALVKRSFVLQELAHQLSDTHGVDWNSFAGYRRFIELLDFVNIRIFRGSAKSSIGQDAILWDITRDPNNTILLVSASDDRARSFSSAIRDVVMSDVYRALFPERVPRETKTELTERAIWLAGRTLNSPQACLEAYGYKSTVVGAHYSTFDIDDLVTETNVYDIDGANRFLSGLTGLQMPMRIRRRHRGTVWDENDDNYTLRQIAHCLTLTVPIETYEGAVDDITVRGVPTLNDPEWWEGDPQEAIARKLAETLANPLEGARSWRMNFLLDPTAGGGRLFTQQMIDASAWRRLKVPDDEKHAYGTKDPFHVGKYVWENGERARHDDGALKVVRVRPSQMKRFLGCDQAFSSLETSDEWAVSCIAQDAEGSIFVLETLHGHGYEDMMDALLEANERWKPQAIGIEKASMQEATMWWIDRHPSYRKIRGKVVPITHNNQRKDIRIQNLVAEPMKSHMLFVSPEDLELREQMVRYKARDKKAKDDLIDSVAIAMATLKRPSQAAKTREAIRQVERRIDAHTDPLTGIYIGY